MSDKLLQQLLQSYYGGISNDEYSGNIENSKNADIFSSSQSVRASKFNLGGVVNDRENGQVINFEDDIIVTRDGEVKRIDEDVPIFKNSRTRTEYINPKNLSSNVPQPYRKPISGINNDTFNTNSQFIKNYMGSIDDINNIYLNSILLTHNRNVTFLKDVNRREHVGNSLENLPSDSEWGGNGWESDGSGIKHISGSDSLLLIKNINNKNPNGYTSDKSRYFVSSYMALFSFKISNWKKGTIQIKISYDIISNTRGKLQGEDNTHYRYIYSDVFKEDFIKNKDGGNTLTIEDADKCHSIMIDGIDLGNNATHPLLIEFIPSDDFDGTITKTNLYITYSKDDIRRDEQNPNATKGNDDYMYIITNAYEIELKEVNENKYNQHPILYKDNLLYVGSGEHIIIINIIVYKLDYPDIWTWNNNKGIKLSYEVAQLYKGNIVGITNYGDKIVLYLNEYGNNNGYQYFRDGVYLSPMDEYKRQSLPFINVSTQGNVDYAVCGNANKQRLFAVQGANRKELFESNWKKYPYIIDGQRSEDLNINSYYPQRPYSIGYFDNKVLIPDIIQNVYGYGYNKLSQYAMTNMFSANADNRGITCIKNTVDKVFIFYTDRKTGWNSYIINTDTPADYFSVSFPKFVMRQSIIKTLNNLKIGYNFMKDSDKIQVFVSVNDYYFWVFKPKGEFIIPEKGEAYNYGGIPGASNRLLFERIDTINNEPRLVFHLEGNITEFYFTSDLYSDSGNHILVEDFTNFVFVGEETSKGFGTGYFEIGNISQKINAPKVQKMQFKVVGYGYAEIFDSEFTSYLTNNV